MVFWDSVKLEVIKTALACVTLGFGWYVGQRIIAYWDLRKKRQELDIALAREFHKLYGEFKEVSRLWRAFTFTGDRTQPLVFPDATRVELLKRATASEGALEAMVVKLATERELTADDVSVLGSFRQIYQQLRRVIRDGGVLHFYYGTPDYTTFNDLASQIACIISSNRTRMCPKSEAPGILRQITAVRSGQPNDERNRQAAAHKGNSVS